MKKVFMGLLAVQICLSGLGIHTTMAAAEDTNALTECAHEWEDSIEIVHHEAEYTTKTVWMDWGSWLATLENGTLPEGPNKYHINYNGNILGTYTDMYDLYCWYYETLENIPEEYVISWITIDNYEEYGLSYEEFCSQTEMYSIFGDLNPEFNPEYDELVRIEHDLATDIFWGENGLYDHGICKKFRTVSIQYPDGTEPYYPASQELLCISEAYDETLIHHVCAVCGESYDSIAENIVKGDVNYDGEFTIADVILLQKWLLCVPDTELVNWKAGDLCDDSKLDVFDLCFMKRLLIYGDE